MELASANREPSLFAVAKLLETALVNLDRVDVVWRSITNHLLVVCQHPHLRMRQVSNNRENNFYNCQLAPTERSQLVIWVSIDYIVRKQ